MIQGKLVDFQRANFGPGALPPCSLSQPILCTNGSGPLRNGPGSLQKCIHIQHIIEQCKVYEDLTKLIVVDASVWTADDKQ